MRNKLISFFRLRRQSDAVKLICMFGLVGLACLSNVAYHLWEISCAVNAPAEYVLMGEGKISQKRMDELGRNKAVTGLSRQMERSIAVMYGGREAAIHCTLLSAEYLEGMFHTDLSAGTKKIWMNRAAFSELKEQLGEDGQGTAEIGVGEGDGVTEFNVRYSEEDDPLSQEENAPAKYRTAKLIVVGRGGEEEEGAAFMAESESRLQRGADGLRVQFAKHDLDGLQVEALRKLGYEIQNEEEVIAEECQLETRLLHIKYGLFSCALCVAAALGLKILR